MNRKYRDRESGENITIIIPVIICLIARARAKQYTKRLLPNFLTPHSVIRLDHLLEAADLPETDRTEAAVCDLLGCLDPRTARYQMRRLTTAIQVVSLELARRRAAMPELGELPEISPETCCPAVFCYRPGDVLRTVLYDSIVTRYHVDHFRGGVESHSLQEVSDGTIHAAGCSGHGYLTAGTLRWFGIDGGFSLRR